MYIQCEVNMANNKTSNIYIRIEPEVKKEAEEILSRLGIGASLAVNMFYKQIILHQGMPFDVVIPSSKNDKKVISQTIENKVDKPVILKETTKPVQKQISKPVEIKESKQKEEVRELSAKEKEEIAIAEIKKKYGL